MSNDTIKCPGCGTQIDLTEILRKKVAKEVEQEFDKKMQAKIKELNAEGDAALDRAQKQLEEAHKNELILRKQKTELEQKAKDIDLEVQRRLDSEKELLETRVGDRIAESCIEQSKEKDKKIADALQQVDELRRKMEQGSQQSQGEILELELEETLKFEYPLDLIEPVAKGVKGGDILQTVRSKTGEEAGKILWELKRTKAFSEGWLAKMKADARNAKASILILATETLPAGIETFGMLDGVWVTSIQIAIPLSRSLRFGMTQVARERLMQSGKKEKAEVMYEYLIGDEFRGRIEALVDAYKGMREDLEAERRAMEKIWAKREKQIGQVTLNLAGMHGEFQALAGESLPGVKLLELA